MQLLQNDWPEAAVMVQVKGGTGAQVVGCCVTVKSGLIFFPCRNRTEHGYEEEEAQVEPRVQEYEPLLFSPRVASRGTMVHITFPGSPGHRWLTSCGHPVKAGPARCRSLGMWTWGPERLG